MKDKKLIVLGAGIIGFLALFYLIFFVRQVMDDRYDETPVVKESEAKIHNYDNWVEYTSKLSHFRVYFPKTPQTEAKAITIAGEDRVKAGLHIFISEFQDQSTLMIKVTRFPNDYKIKDVNFQLKETMNAILNANKENVLRDIKETTWQGHDALNFAIENQEIRIEAKSVFANQSIYTLVYAARINQFEAHVFQQFLERFVITTDFKLTSR